MKGDKKHFTRAHGWSPERSWPAGSLMLLLLFLLPVSSTAQGRTDEVEVAVAALPTLRRSLPAGAAALDPEAFCRARLVGWACPAPLQSAAEALGFRLNSRSFVHVCMTGENSCELIGAESLVVLEEPEISRNTATLRARVWWRASDRPGTLNHRRVRLSLTRRPSGWRVVESESPPD